MTFCQSTVANLPYRDSGIVVYRNPDCQARKTRGMATSGDRERTAFGTRMHAARIRAEKTQVQVARELGIGQSTIVDAERVANGVPWVVAAARLYNVSVEWLALGEGSPEDPYVGTGDAQWPFEEVERARFMRLTPVQRGIVEGEVLKAIERIEADAQHRKRVSNGTP